MKIVAKTENNDIATVYVARTKQGKLIEFVESVQPPIPREEKWVLIISTLYGCPVKCKFCDSGGFYNGKLSKEDIFDQIDFMVSTRFPNRKLSIPKFKIQFARMGEPALNPAVLDVLDEFDQRFDAPGFLPSVSTIAPIGCESFLERLLEIKNEKYLGNFQMQFSIHTTDEERRNWLIPVRKWSFQQIADFGKRFKSKEDKKITLNFALAKENVIDTDVLLKYFDPDIFLIKITPINPTYKAEENHLSSAIFDKDDLAITDKIREVGYDVILSIGELEENQIGSNCGQHLMNYMNENEKPEGAYSYSLEKCEECISV
jgi:23S rRNA (adenine2503-C2)-methyltransferase